MNSASRVAAVLIALAPAPAVALDFPESCVSPTATVTEIGGVDTRGAHMEARYTLPDIIEGCNQGYVDQGVDPPDKCIERNRELLNSPPLHASADCEAAIVFVEGERTILPAHADCASGGTRAIEVFKILCPSYRGQIELKD